MMKRVLIAVALMLVLGGCGMTSMSLEPEVLACRKGCGHAYEECKKRAGENQAKTIACRTTYNKCLEKCADL